LAQEQNELHKLVRTQSASSAAACDPQVEWFDRVLVPFTSAEVPNEGGSAFGVERAIRAVTIAFWASLLLNFRRALRPSTGAVPSFHHPFFSDSKIYQAASLGLMQRNFSNCGQSSTEATALLASVLWMRCAETMSAAGCRS
jgi:hypothetical protein